MSIESYANGFSQAPYMLVRENESTKIISAWENTPWYKSRHKLCVEIKDNGDMAIQTVSQGAFKRLLCTIITFGQQSDFWIDSPVSILQSYQAQATLSTQCQADTKKSLAQIEVEVFTTLLGTWQPTDSLEQVKALICAKIDTLQTGTPIWITAQKTSALASQALMNPNLIKIRETLCEGIEQLNAQIEGILTKYLAPNFMGLHAQLDEIKQQLADCRTKYLASPEDPAELFNATQKFNDRTLLCKNSMAKVVGIWSAKKQLDTTIQAFTDQLLMHGSQQILDLWNASLNNLEPKNSEIKTLSDVTLQQQHVDTCCQAILNQWKTEITLANSQPESENQAFNQCLNALPAAIQNILRPVKLNNENCWTMLQKQLETVQLPELIKACGIAMTITKTADNKLLEIAQDALKKDGMHHWHQQALTKMQQALEVLETDTNTPIALETFTMKELEASVQKFSDRRREYATKKEQEALAAFLIYSHILETSHQQLINPSADMSLAEIAQGR